LWALVTIGLLVSAVVSGVPPVAAQTGQVTGTAKDALGRPLSRAQVRLESSDGRVAGQTTADDQGMFSFSNVARRAPMSSSARRKDSTPPPPW
jgi:hypothetical protein